MKKLLCVLMFGMVFGQDVITTREYTIPISSDMETFNMLGVIENLNGIYEIQPIYFESNDEPSNGCGISLVGEAENLLTENNGMIIESVLNDWTGEYNWNLSMWSTNDEIYIDNQNYMIYITPTMWGEPDAYPFCAVISGSFTIRIKGRFDDTDTSLNGDMNDDGTLDVLDVVSLVQEILNGGMGDVGDLLNILRG